jgi:DNA replication protein DnaC
MSAAPQLAERIGERLLAFKLPTASAEMVPRLVAAGQADALLTVLEVFDLEAEDRRERRIQRLRKASRLPPGKTFATFNQKRLPNTLAQKLKDLAQGTFVDHCVNVLAFGLPGTGKSHAACALGHALIEAGRSVLFTPTYALVQDLLTAKRDLALPRALRKLDLFEVLVLDDLGYVQQSADETGVLFTLMSERYERRSMVITSNLVFSQWDQIFKNPMTTASAIDRVVHHSVILEFDVPSYRTEKAQKRKGESETRKTQAEA